MALTIKHKRKRGRRVFVGLVAVTTLLIPDFASARTRDAVAPNVVVVTNVRDGSIASQTSFVLHQVELAADGSISVLTDPDVRQGRRHNLPAQGRRLGRAVPRGGGQSGTSYADADAGLDPAEIQARAEATVAQLLGALLPEPQSGLRLGNFALAYNACSDCRSLATAVQLVMISGLSSPLTSVNVSMAINENCQNCVAGAYAYQLVVVTNQPVTLDPATLAAVSRARQHVAWLAHSREPMGEVLNALAAAVEGAEVALVRRVIG